MSIFNKIAAPVVLFTTFLLPDAASLAAVTTGSSPDDDEQETYKETSCPRHLQRRSAEQVMESHLAAFRSGNATLIACDYARNAVFMLPGTVAQGREDIRATFAAFFQNAGSINSVSVASMTTHDGAVLMTYKVDSLHILVSDGVDTLVIKKGLIVLHTAYLGGLSTR